MSGRNSGIKILTDMKIDQCPVWRQETDCLNDGSDSDSLPAGRLSQFARLMALMKFFRRYDVVITADIRTAQIFGLVRSLFGWRRPKHIILELMLDESSDSLRWKVKRFVQRFCFGSVDVVFVSSRMEIPTYAERLGLPEQRIRFLPFHTNVVNPMMIEGTGGFILSAGKTGRDFATLASAVEGLNVRVVVVSDRGHIEGIVFPPNVEVRIDIPYRSYLELLHRCSMVVVPLKRLVKSTGQVVFLEAMALGKPVVATNTIGTQDYIEHGVTGILVPPEDSGAMQDAVKGFIESPSIYSAMALRALQKVKECHTFAAYTGLVLATAREIAFRDA